MWKYITNLLGYPSNRMNFTPSPEKFEDLNSASSEAFDVGNVCWSGVNINLQNYLSPAGFLTCHMLNLGKKENVNPMTGEKDDERASYNFVALCKSGPLMVNARYGTGGATRAVVDLNFGGAGASAQLYLGQGGMNHFETELFATAAGSYMQFKFLGSAVGLSYASHILPDVHVGSEFITTGNDNRIKGMTKITGGDGSTTVLSATVGLGPSQLSACYTKRVLDFLDLSTGLDFTSEKQGWSSVVKVGFVGRLKMHGETEADTPKPDNWPVHSRGTFDTKGKVSVFMEEQVSETSAFNACVSGDLFKQNYDWGVGFNAAS